MNEIQWAQSVVKLLRDRLAMQDASLQVSHGTRLPYASEILAYTELGPESSQRISYETDILVTEQLSQSIWKPRLVIECKINHITTHDAITYSQKAFTHKNVHPYLRYGILIGDRGRYPLPGRLFRHGAYFDFMMSWKNFEPSDSELNDLMELVHDEVAASRNLEEIFYNSRSSARKRYTILHRPLNLK